MSQRIEIGVKEGDETVEYRYLERLAENAIFWTGKFALGREEVIIKKIYKYIDNFRKSELIDKILNADKLRKKYKKELDGIMPSYRFIDLEEQGLMVIDYIEGEVLDNVFDLLHLAEDDPAQLIMDFRVKMMMVLEAVLRLRELELVHGDIKPGNIVVNDNAYLIDIDSLACAGTSLEGELLNFCTRYYAHPLVKRGISVHPETDLFSLSVICYDFVDEMYQYYGITDVSGIEEIASRAFDDKGELQMAIPEIQDALLYTGNKIAM